MEWTSDFPDGGRQQNFVGLRPKQREFNDIDLEMEICVSCEIERTTMFTLRGICKNSYLETEYFPSVCGGFVGFVGNMVSIWYKQSHSIMYFCDLIVYVLYFSYDETNNRWIARHIKYPAFQAVLNANSAFGPNKWTIHNDSKVCGWDESYRSTLSLSSCSLDHFTCGDGNCVNMDKR